MKCPGCETILEPQAKQCENCGMRFDLDTEFTIDWGAIDQAHQRQRRSWKSKIMPFILWAISITMLIWLASPYQPITRYIFNQDQAVELRDVLQKDHRFPPVDTYVKGTELALGYKGAEWMRLRRFGITREEVVYIQIIGAVCPYEMPRERCRKVLIEVPKSDTDFEDFRPATVVTVDGRLHQITKTSEFAPLIPFLASEMNMDVDGAYVIAHGVRPKWGRDAWIFWGVVFFITILLSFFLRRLIRS